MGIYKEERDVAKQQEAEKSAKTYITCLWSFLVSMTGGLILGFWEYEYHPTYGQLWMVPLGLILFLTPVIVWFAVFISELCMLDEEHVRRAMSHQSVRSLGDHSSVHDPER
ncbi:hypothetical protein CICLE_v10022962mg [Citrus x clementina]|uniref:Uncharacterized protein n=2 Tax=Citrus TaxID=2706 RepID=A0ACB8MNY0_CITSI|nr:hypothetical protein CICLE_v10022962mg [Citrus x clementina]KAH9787312.1 hypothetical protein KPL71_010546 [Citrus sinensis]